MLLPDFIALPSSYILLVLSKRKHLVLKGMFRLLDISIMKVLECAYC